MLPNLTLLADKRIDNIFDIYDIISLIPNVNPINASGFDGISGQKLLICDETVVSSETY